MSFLKELATTVGVKAVKASNRVFISDTTLRDGEQTAGAAIGIAAKVEIARALEAAGVDAIEAGFPIASKVDLAAAREIAQTLRRASVSALSRARREDIDAAYTALKDAKVRRSVSIFIAVCPLQREKKFKRSVDEIVDIAVDAVKYARDKFDVVAFGAEDMTRTEPEHVWRINEAVIDAGARAVSLTDTLGVLTPEETTEWVRGMKTRIPNIGKALLATHLHNDLGLGLANALAAIREGVSVVQTTVNGIGERAGNVALEELAFVLEFKKKIYGKKHGVDLKSLYALSRLVADRMGMPVNPHKSVVGERMFVTAAGLHQTAIAIDPAMYEPFPPETVGAPKTFLELSRHSSLAGFKWRIERLGITLAGDALKTAFDRFQELADGKKLVNDDDLRQICRPFCDENSER